MGAKEMASQDSVADAEDHQDLSRDVAIVGLSVVFSGDADTEESFWSTVLEGRSTSAPIPATRWSADGFYDPDYTQKGTMPLKHSHFVSGDIKAFDAPFFSISASEAAGMDPQQRKLLEVTYHALENAGISIQSCSGSRTAVFTGCFSDDYRQMTSKDPETASSYAATGTYATFLANRISWFFNLTGTSMNIDTACSSSLVALDLARQNLLAGESDMVIVAGANLLLHPDPFLIMSTAGLLSKDGKCHSFDQRANGYARGEGYAAIILKRVNDAIKDNDTLRAVVRSSGSNQDARTPGITQPDENAQYELIRRTYEKAGLNPKLTRYVEAHGTGTPVGDPIEQRALGRVFGKTRSVAEPLFVGSVKANIGHTEGASGLAGLVKTVLILERGVIPPNAHLQQINKAIYPNDYNIEYPRTAIDWPSLGLRRASVNSFGFGGTNAHVVLDDAYHYLRLRNLHSIKMHRRSLSIQESTESKKLVVFSASDHDGINRVAQSLCSYFQSKDTAAINFDHLVYTLNQRRSFLRYRSCAIIQSLTDMQRVGTIVSKPQKCDTTTPKIGFIFTGQGAQWPRMCLELMRYDEFRTTLKLAQVYLSQLGCPWSLIEELSKDQSNSILQRPDLSQTICTIVQVGLVKLLKAFGVQADTVIGHSSGEIAAAYCLGAISFRNAVRIAYHRGRVVNILATSNDNTQQGAMMAARISVQAARDYIQQLDQQYDEPDVVIACINSPKTITFSGRREQISTLEGILQNDGHFARILKVDVAYHSRHMLSVSEVYMEAIRDIDANLELQPVQGTMFSSVTGNRIEPQQVMRPQYWVDNLTQPVQFDQAVGNCLAYHNDTKVDVLVEIGPHPALQGPVREIMEERQLPEISYLASSVRNSSNIATILELAGKLWCKGFPIELGAVNATLSNDAANVVLNNLPSYPFDHSKTYWHESRLSRRFRLREHNPSHLLGVPSSDWNILQPSWRNNLRHAQLPWLRDHRINDVLLLPAAAMLAMAVEAAQQIADNHEIQGFNLINVNFIAALQVPDSDDTGKEVYTSLKRDSNQSNAYMTYFTFEIHCFERDQAIKCCEGAIQVHYARHTLDPVTSRQTHVSPLDAHEQEETSFSSLAFYSTLKSCGLEFGPSFQRIYNGSSSDHSVKAELTQYQDSRSPGPQSLHAVTLDTILHSLLAAISHGGQKNISTAIPSSMQKMWIAAGDFDHSEYTSLLAIGKIVDGDQQGFTGSVMAVEQHAKLVRCHVEGLSMRFVADLKNITPAEQQQQRCLKVQWQQDIASIKADDNLEQQTAVSDESGARQFYESLTLILGVFVVRALKAETELVKTDLPEHFQKYVDWLHCQLSTSTPEVMAAWKLLADDPVQFAALCDQVRLANTQGLLSVVVGESLLDILHGRSDALSIMMRENMLEQFYRDVNERVRSWYALGPWLDAYTFKNPAIRILEIGAGTGSSTRLILNQLTSATSSRRYLEYCFTDISAAFFEKAKAEFADFTNISFKRLDIEQDLQAQGFELHSWDMVIAGNVLHATKNINNTLSNVRSLLKDDGKLVLFEITRPEILRTGFVMGLLPGWWLSEEAERAHGPCMTTANWDSKLSATGFSGNEVILNDFCTPSCQEVSIIISSAVPQIQPQQDPNTSILIIVNNESALQIRLAQQLQQELTSYRTSIISPIDYNPELAGSSCIISLLEIDSPYLVNMSSTQFEQLKNLICNSNRMIWITNGSSKLPDYSVIDGLARVSKSELLTKIIKISVQVDQTFSAEQLSILRNTLKQDVHQDQYESTITEEGGNFHLSRLVQDTSLTRLMMEDQNEHETTTTLQNAGPVHAFIKTPGLLETLGFTRSDHMDDQLVTTDVEIQVHAAGLNFKDCLIASGAVREQNLGMEASGVITRIGSNTTGLNVGDRVVAIGFKAFSNVLRTNQFLAVKLPDRVSFETAAAMPANFFTAWQALHVARLQKGESILVQSGAGGTGQAIIQLAQLRKANIYATVGSIEKKQFLIDTYKLDPNNIFWSRDAVFGDHISSIGGVDVVVNSLSGSGLRAAWKCVAPYGRFIEIGKRDILANENLPMGQFEKNISFTALDAFTMAMQKPHLFQQGMQELIGLTARNQISPAGPLKTYSIGALEDAFRALYKGDVIGKVVIRMESDAQIKLYGSVTRLDPTKTYLIAGGLGGLGQSIVSWMVGKGARNVLLLTRSGATSTTLPFIDKLRSMNVNIWTPKCDITSLPSLTEALNQPDMPPIAGCIQATMVLRDSLISSMSYDDWNAAIKPKIAGSWNLHTILPEDLDFFVLLSSVNGIIGHGGQANYAAGNTYMDDLARFRVQHGQKAVSLDLGVMSDSGYLAENPQAMSRMLAEGHYVPVTNKQLFALLDHYCDSNLNLSTPEEAQVVIGLEMPADEKPKPSWMSAALFRHLHVVNSSQQVEPQTQSASVNHGKRLAAATTDSEATDIVTEALVGKIALSLGLEAKDIEPTQSLASNGIDSLLAIELRSWIVMTFDANIPLFKMLAAEHLLELAGTVAHASSKRAEPQPE